MECEIFQSLLCFSNCEELIRQMAKHHTQVHTEPPQDSETGTVLRVTKSAFP
jgi:hypothetical protein